MNSHRLVPLHIVVILSLLINLVPLPRVVQASPRPAASPSREPLWLPPAEAVG